MKTEMEKKIVAIALIFSLALTQCVSTVFAADGGQPVANNQQGQMVPVIAFDPNQENSKPQSSIEKAKAESETIAPPIGSIGMMSVMEFLNSSPLSPATPEDIDTNIDIHKEAEAKKLAAEETSGLKIESNDMILGASSDITVDADGQVISEGIVQAQTAGAGDKTDDAIGKDLDEQNLQKNPPVTREKGADFEVNFYNPYNVANPEGTAENPVPYNNITLEVSGNLNAKYYRVEPVDAEGKPVYGGIFQQGATRYPYWISDQNRFDIPLIYLKALKWRNNAFPLEGVIRLQVTAWDERPNVEEDENKLPIACTAENGCRASQTVDVNYDFKFSALEFGISTTISADGEITVKATPQGASASLADQAKHYNWAFYTYDSQTKAFTKLPQSELFGAAQVTTAPELKFRPPEPGVYYVALENVYNNTPYGWQTSYQGMSANGPFPAKATLDASYQKIVNPIAIVAQTQDGKDPVFNIKDANGNYVPMLSTDIRAENGYEVIRMPLQGNAQFTKVFSEMDILPSVKFYLPFGGANNTATNFYCPDTVEIEIPAGVNLTADLTPGIYTVTDITGSASVREGYKRLKLVRKATQWGSTWGIPLAFDYSPSAVNGKYDLKFRIYKQSDPLGANSNWVGSTCDFRAMPGETILPKELITSLPYTNFVKMFGTANLNADFPKLLDLYKSFGFNTVPLTGTSNRNPDTSTEYFTDEQTAVIDEAGLFLGPQHSTLHGGFTGPGLYAWLGNSGNYTYKKISDTSAENLFNPVFLGITDANMKVEFTQWLNDLISKGLNLETEKRKWLNAAAYAVDGRKFDMAYVAVDGILALWDQESLRRVLEKTNPDRLEVDSERFDNAFNGGKDALKSANCAILESMDAGYAGEDNNQKRADLIVKKLVEKTYVNPVTNAGGGIRISIFGAESYMNYGQQALKNNVLAQYPDVFDLAPARYDATVDMESFARSTRLTAESKAPEQRFFSYISTTTGPYIGQQETVGAFDLVAQSFLNGATGILDFEMIPAVYDAAQYVEIARAVTAIAPFEKSHILNGELAYRDVKATNGVASAMRARDGDLLIAISPKDANLPVTFTVDSQEAAAVYNIYDLGNNNASLLRDIVADENGRLTFTVNPGESTVLRVTTKVIDAPLKALYRAAEELGVTANDILSFKTSGTSRAPGVPERIRIVDAQADGTESYSFGTMKKELKEDGEIDYVFTWDAGDPEALKAIQMLRDFARDGVAFFDINGDGNFERSDFDMAAELLEAKGKYGDYLNAEESAQLVAKLDTNGDREFDAKDVERFDRMLGEVESVKRFAGNLAGRISDLNGDGTVDERDLEEGTKGFETAFTVLKYLPSVVLFVLDRNKDGNVDPADLEIVISDIKFEIFRAELLTKAEDEIRSLETELSELRGRLEAAKREYSRLTELFDSDSRDVMGELLAEVTDPLTKYVDLKFPSEQSGYQEEIAAFLDEVGQYLAPGNSLGFDAKAKLWKELGLKLESGLLGAEMAIRDASRSLEALRAYEEYLKEMKNGDPIPEFPPRYFSAWYPAPVENPLPKLAEYVERGRNLLAGIRVPENDVRAVNFQLTESGNPPVMSLEAAVITDPDAISIGGEAVKHHLYRFHAERAGVVYLVYYEYLNSGSNMGGIGGGFFGGTSGITPPQMLTRVIRLEVGKDIPVGGIYELVLARGGAGVEVARHDYRWLTVQEMRYVVQNIERQVQSVKKFSEKVASGSLDFNGDGALTGQDEGIVNENYMTVLRMMPYLPPDVLRQLDYNRDGAVNRADFDALVNEIRRKIAQVVSVSQFAVKVANGNLDSNGDRQLTEGDVTIAADRYKMALEVMQYLPADIFKKLDYDKDGKVTNADSDALANEIRRNIGLMDSVKQFADVLRIHGEDVDRNNYYDSRDEQNARTNFGMAFQILPYLPGVVFAALDLNKDGKVEQKDLGLLLSRIAQRRLEQQNAFRLALLEYRNNYGSTMGVVFNIEAIEKLPQPGPHGSVVSAVFRVTALRRGVQTAAFQIRTMEYPPVAGRAAKIYEIGDLSSMGTINAYRSNGLSFNLAYQYIDRNFFCRWTTLCGNW